jgi:hypothetical protein
MIGELAVAAALLLGPTVIADYPEHVCGWVAAPLNEEWDVRMEPASDDPLPEDATIEVDAEDVEEVVGGEPDEDPQPTWWVQPWRVVEYPDGTVEQWHDDRCVPDGYEVGLADPGTTP